MPKGLDVDVDTCLRVRRNRTTGVEVGLEFHPGEDECCRWQTVCYAHSMTVGHETRAVAEFFLPVPWEWCEDCTAPDHLSPRDVASALKLAQAQLRYMLHEAPGFPDERRHDTAMVLDRVWRARRAKAQWGALDRAQRELGELLEEGEFPEHVRTDVASTRRHIERALRPPAWPCSWPEPRS